MTHVSKKVSDSCSWRNIRETDVVLEDVVAGEVVEGEPRGVGLRVGGDSKVKEELGKLLAKVDGVREAVGEVVEGDILARARQEAVVCKGVQEGTWTPD